MQWALKADPGEYKSIARSLRRIEAIVTSRSNPQIVYSPHLDPVFESPRYVFGSS